MNKLILVVKGHWQGTNSNLRGVLLLFTVTCSMKSTAAIKPVLYLMTLWCGVGVRSGAFPWKRSTTKPSVRSLPGPLTWQKTTMNFKSQFVVLTMIHFFLFFFFGKKKKKLDTCFLALLNFAPWPDLTRNFRTFERKTKRATRWSDVRPLWRVWGELWIV